MTNPITTLTCPTCGSRLSIVKGIDRFTCGHCGNEHIVKRESGIVYLEPIAEDVRQIRASVENINVGVDRTAAELAIPRLTKEIGELEGQLEAAQASVQVRPSTDIRPRTSREIGLIVLSFLLFLIGLILLNYQGICFVFGLISSTCLVVFLRESKKLDREAQKMKQDAIQEKQDVITGIEGRISDKKTALERTRKLLD